MNVGGLLVRGRRVTRGTVNTEVEVRGAKGSRGGGIKIIDWSKVAEAFVVRGSGGEWR